MNISIIIPNYNGEELLKKNIPQILLIAKQDVEIIVVDDASSDNSVKYLKSLGSKIRLIQNIENIGFARSVNKAVQQAYGDIIILLNSDVVPKKDFLKPLISHFENEKVFAVGCLDESVEGEHVVKRGRGVGKWHKGFLVHSAGNIEKKNTLWASGGSSAFKKEIWTILDGFSDLYYPFYWEDIDLSYRAWKAGYVVKFEQKSVVVHSHDEGAIKKNFSSKFIKSVAYKNQFIFIWKNITDVSLLLSHIFYLPYHIAIALKNLDSAFFVGFLKALLLVPNIIKSNLSSKTVNKLSDKEVLNLFPE